MDTTTAAQRLGALSQTTRLDAFRLLVKCGDEGLPAGDIARSLDVPHNTMSTHLNILSGAGLIRSRRDGRSIIYRVDFSGMRTLLGWLVDDCCRGRPEFGAPLGRRTCK